MSTRTRARRPIPAPRDARTPVPTVLHLLDAEDRPARSALRLLSPVARNLVLSVVHAADEPVSLQPRGAEWELRRPADGRDQPAVDAALAHLLAAEDVHLLHQHSVTLLTTGPRPVEVAYHRGVPTLVSLHGRPAEPDPTTARTWAEGMALVDGATAASEALLSTAADRVWWPSGRAVLGQVGSTHAAAWRGLYADLIGPLGPVPGSEVLSVVVTTYDRPAALRDCLEGLVGSTLPQDRFEVVVVDDASPCSAESVVAEFADRLDLVFVRHDTNQGCGGARNTGVKAARGSVVLLLDDDDVVNPRCLAEHLRRHVLDPDPWLAVLGRTGLSTELLEDPVMHALTAVGQQYLGYRGMTDGLPLPWNALWGGRSSMKRQALLDEPFEIPFMEDTDLAWRIRDRSTVVHGRHATQSIGMGMTWAEFTGRSNKMGVAARKLVARHDDPGLTADMGMHDGPRLRTLEHAAPLAEQILALLEGRGLSELRAQHVVLDEHAEGLPGLAARLHAVFRVPQAPAGTTTADCLLDHALTVCGEHQKHVGHLMEARTVGLTGPATFLHLPDWTDDDDLVATIRLFAEAFAPGDPARLLVALPGGDPDAALELLSGLLETAGIDPSALPDVQITPCPDGLPAADFWLPSLRASRPVGTYPVHALDPVDGLRRCAGLPPRSAHLR